MFYYCLYFFQSLYRLYSLSISKSKKVFNLSNYNRNSNTCCKSRCNRIWDKFNECTKSEYSHKYKQYSRNQGGNYKSIHSIFGNNSCHYRSKCSGRSCYLNAASSEKRNQKSRYNCSVDSLFRCNPRCKCQCNRKWQCNNCNYDSGYYILRKLLSIIILDYAKKLWF